MNNLATDARNRALRSFLQGLGITIGTAVVVSILSALGTAGSWSEFGGVLVGFAFFQSVATSVLSWVMRTVLDPSGIPTPLPPADPGEPDAVVDERGHARAGDGWLLLVSLGLLLAFVLVMIATA